MAGVAAISAFAFAAPAASAALPDVGGVASTATSTAGSTVGAVEAQATETIATADQVTSSAAQTVSKTPPAPRVKPPAPRITPRAPRVKSPVPPAPSVEVPPVPSVEVPSTPDLGRATADLAREVDRTRDKITQPLGDLRELAPVGDVMSLLGSTLRGIAPVGGLLAPVAPLLGGPGVVNELPNGLPNLGASVAPVQAQPPIGVHLPPAGGVLGAQGTPASASSQTFQAASARPPAAEVGGRPVSPIPWTAPAPAAGGAAAVFSGSVFVPFLGLLVLAALAAPRLMRRLDELPAFVRPGPFLCALERPG